LQGVSLEVADMITEIDAADYLTLAAAWRLDQGLPANREIASAKLYASEMLLYRELSVFRAKTR
jgi:acyl-CoA dehydrogenase